MQYFSRFAAVIEGLFKTLGDKAGPWMSAFESQFERRFRNRQPRIACAAGRCYGAKRRRYSSIRLHSSHDKRILELMSIFPKPKRKPLFTVPV